MTPSIDAIFERLAGYGARPALWSEGRTIDYAGLLALVARWQDELAGRGVGRGGVCALVDDYSPDSCAVLLALLRMGAVAVPFTPASALEMERLLDIAGAERVLRLDHEDGPRWMERPPQEANPLVARFRTEGRSGLVVFTSGSTGAPKGILHDGERVASKFAKERRGWRTLLFLLMDHFGGYNTFLSVLASGGLGICVANRTPDAVCEAIEQARAELLPATPTFLNMLLVSGAWRRRDLSSVRLITYGTELMPEATLARVRKAFPEAECKQTYGLSELGVLRSQSPDGDSTWLRVGGDGFETRVTDGTLWVRSASNMVGYLNAPDPFDAEGWMNTGDQVEERDGLVRFLGRRNEVVNVGGQKVFPIEVEDVLLQAPNLREAAVYGMPHKLLGQVVAARISLDEPEEADALAARLRRHCLERLQKYKVPMRFEVVDAGDQASERFKKRRGPAS